MRRGALVVAAILAAACAGDNGGRNAGAAMTMADTAASAPAGLIQGTPAGGLATWVEDVRAGLAHLPEEAAEGASAAQQQALDLYIGRQEYIEMYYGAGGRVAGSPELGEAVSAAEERFHELMQLLGGTPAPPAAAVETARDALYSQYDAVLREAERAGVPMDPRTVVGGGA